MKLAQIGKVIDWIGKNINRIKTIGKVLLMVVFVLSLGNNGCQRNKAIDLAKKLTELDFTNLVLRKDITQKDSVNFQLEKENDSLSVVINELENKADVLERRGDGLQADLRELKDSLINIPTDSSYAFLQAVYPYPGEFKYPFNEPQVRNIHLDYLENRSLWSVNNNLNLQVDNCQDIMEANYKRAEKYRAQTGNFKAQKTNYEKIINNKDTEIDLLEGNVKKEKKKKGVWKVLTGIAAGIAILFAI